MTCIFPINPLVIFFLYFDLLIEVDLSFGILQNYMQNSFQENRIMP